MDGESMTPFKTLIVEDNVSFRQTLLEILAIRFPFMSIKEAGDGDEAFKEIDLSTPDLIFMDIKLPGGKWPPTDPKDKNEICRSRGYRSYQL